MKENNLKWYKFGLWTAEMVLEAVEKNVLTEEDAKAILG